MHESDFPYIIPVIPIVKREPENDKNCNDESMLDTSNGNQSGVSSSSNCNGTRSWLKSENNTSFSSSSFVKAKAGSFIAKQKTLPETSSHSSLVAGSALHPVAPSLSDGVPMEGVEFTAAAVAALSSTNVCASTRPAAELLPGSMNGIDAAGTAIHNLLQALLLPYASSGQQMPSSAGIAQQMSAFTRPPSLVAPAAVNLGSLLQLIYLAQSFGFSIDFDNRRLIAPIPTAHQFSDFGSIGSAAMFALRTPTSFNTATNTSLQPSCKKSQGTNHKWSSKKDPSESDDAELFQSTDEPCVVNCATSFLPSLPYATTSTFPPMATLSSSTMHYQPPSSTATFDCCYAFPAAVSDYSNGIADFFGYGPTVVATAPGAGGFHCSPPSSMMASTAGDGGYSLAAMLASGIDHYAAYGGFAASSSGGGSTGVADLYAAASFSQIPYTAAAAAVGYAPPQHQQIQIPTPQSAFSMPPYAPYPPNLLNADNRNSNPSFMMTTPGSIGAFPASSFSANSSASGFFGACSAASAQKHPNEHGFLTGMPGRFQGDLFDGIYNSLPYPIEITSGGGGARKQAQAGGQIRTALHSNRTSGGGGANLKNQALMSSVEGNTLNNRAGNGVGFKTEQASISTPDIQKPFITNTAASEMAPFIAALFSCTDSGGGSPGPVTRERMIEYLSAPSHYECIVSVYAAKVAQKSYGNEKRFFCPPPCVHLRGEGWRLKRRDLEALYRSYLEKTSETSRKDLSSAENRELQQLIELGACIGIGACSGLGSSAVVSADKLLADQNAQQLDFSGGKDYCAAKTLFISDSDKRKYFCLNVGLFYGSGSLQLGVFPSQRIKVISKPSKKKQSMKSTDCKYLCISSGTRVALFNRLRSQTVSTRYLHVENNQFHASAIRWDGFVINILEDACGAPVSSIQQSDGPLPIITYGSIVQLVDNMTNVALPPLRIRKVDKQSVLLDPVVQGEPVSQLHKCAFQMVENEQIYLCLSHDRIIQSQANRMEEYRHQVSDGASWTIISTDKAEYRFFEAMGPTRRPVGPLPVVHSASRSADAADGGRSLELIGLGFSPSLKLWFGAAPSETAFNTPERIAAAIPTFSSAAVSSAAAATFIDSTNVGSAGGLASSVALTLARDDGVLYPTGLYYSYDTGTVHQQRVNAPSSKLNNRFSAAADNGGGGVVSTRQHPNQQQLLYASQRFHPYDHC